MIKKPESVLYPPPPGLISLEPLVITATSPEAAGAFPALAVQVCIAPVFTPL